MLANAAEEIRIREMARPERWNNDVDVTIVSSNGTPIRSRVQTTVTMTIAPEDPEEDTYVIECSDRITVLNCERFLWIEPRAVEDPSYHIFRVDATTFQPAERWLELMRGQDDLVYTTYADKRPDFAGQNGRIQSSGKYSWFFTFLPDSRQVRPRTTVPNNVQIGSVHIGGIPIDPTPLFPPVPPQNRVPLHEAYIQNYTPSHLEFPRRVHRFYVAHAVDVSGAVDVLACYNRVPSDDRQVRPIGFTSSRGGGTYTFSQASIDNDSYPNTSISDISDLLSQTKYVFVTWGTPSQVAGGAWCRIMFVDRSNPAEPKVIVTVARGVSETLPNTANDIQVHIPSGVLYHKRVEGVRIR
jgi:hypothetical protein